LDLIAFTADIQPGRRGFPTLDAIRALKLVVFDVDGVLTDGTIILDDNGVQSKFFNVRDGAGITLLQNGGIQAGILTGRKSNVVDVRAKELKIPDERVRQGAKVKLPVFEKWISEMNLKPHEVAFMGDDLIDLPVLNVVGIACCPSDAHAEVVHASHIMSSKPGGRGAARTICEFLLKARNDGSWERAVDIYLGRA